MRTPLGPIDIPDWQHSYLEIMGGWNVVSGVADFQASKPIWQEGMLSLYKAHRPLRYGMSFTGVADFEVDPAARRIVVDAQHGSSNETLRHLLLDQIWPRILAHEGAFVLHGAGVAMGNGGLLLVGGSGSGKSTLAASLHMAGHAIMGDDAMILAGEQTQPNMRAVYRSLRLFADSLGRIVGPEAPRSPVADYIEKWNVDLPGARDGREAPVRAIFLLDPDPSAEVSIRDVTGAKGAFALVEQSFSLDPSDTAQAAARLQRASSIAEHVPVFRLCYPRDYAQLPRVHEAMMIAAGRPRAELDR